MSLPLSQSLGSRSWNDLICPLLVLGKIDLSVPLGGRVEREGSQQKPRSFVAAPTPKLNVEWPSPNSLPDIYAGCAILSLHFLQQRPRRYNTHSSSHPWVCIKTHVHEVATAMFFNHTAKIFKNITHMCFKYRQIAGKAAGFTPACHSEL